jgi:hypothetical protein
MFASFLAEATPTARSSISCQTLMIALCFMANSRLIWDALPKGPKSNQGYSIDNLLPALNQAMTGNARRKVAPILTEHMDNAMYPNGGKLPRKSRSKDWGEHPIQPIHQISASVTSGRLQQFKKRERIGTYSILKKFRNHGVTSLSKTFKMSSRRGWSD